MHARLRILTAALLLGLAVLGVNPVSAPAQAPQIREITGFGESDHFPLRNGIFRRTHILAYGTAMEDVSIGYNSTAGRFPAATTLYLYPVYNPQGGATATLAYEFEEVKTAIDRFPGGRWTAPREAVVVTQSTGPVAGLSATYRYQASFRGQPVELFTVLHLFLEGDRFVKFRHTYPVVDADLYRPAIDALMSRLKWTGVDANNIAARLGQPL